MNKLISILMLGMVLLSCEERLETPFTKYTIKEGDHYATYAVELLQSDFLSFEAKFDETAIYTSSNEENQWDTNKLFGFSDCNSLHHENSARFGWRWLDGKIDILAYCYVDGNRIIEEIGTTMPGEVNYYQISLTDSHYVFTMDDLTVNIERHKPCDIGGYYLLFPYFGGDDVAPHDIHIFIKRSY